MVLVMKVVLIVFVFFRCVVFSVWRVSRLLVMIFSVSILLLSFSCLFCFLFISNVWSFFVVVVDFSCLVMELLFSMWVSWCSRFRCLFELVVILIVMYVIWLLFQVMFFGNWNIWMLVFSIWLWVLVVLCGIVILLLRNVEVCCLCVSMLLM